MGWIDEGIALFLIIVSSLYLVRQDFLWKVSYGFFLGLLFFGTLSYSKYKRKGEQPIAMNPDEGNFSMNPRSPGGFGP